MAHGLPGRGREPAEAPDRDAVLAAEVAVIRASGRVRRVRLHVAQPGPVLGPVRGPEQAIHFASAGWNEMRHPSPGFDLWHYTNAPPRPEARRGQPGRPLRARGPTSRPRHPAGGARRCRRRPRRRTRRDGSASSRPSTSTASSTRRWCPTSPTSAGSPTSTTSPTASSRTASSTKIAPYTKGAWAHPARPLRLRVLLHARHRARRLGRHRPVRRDDARQRLVLAGAAARHRSSPRWTPPRATGGACRRPTRTSASGTTRRSGGRCRLDDVEEQMRQQDLWRYSDFIHVGSYFLVYRRRVLQDPEFRRRLDDGRQAARQDHDHPQVRDRLLPLPHPRRLPPRDLRRRDPALPPGLPRLGLRPDGRRLPAAEAAVPLREPVLRPRPAAVEAAGARARPRRRRRRDGVATCAASRRRGACTAASPSGPDPTARCELPEPPRPRDLRRRGPLGPVLRPLVGLPGRPAHGPAQRRGPRRLRRGPRRPVGEEDRAARARGRSTSPARTSSACPPRARRGRCTACGWAPSSPRVGPRSDVNHPLSPRHHRFVHLGRPTGLVPPDVGLDGSGDTWGLRDASAVELDDVADPRRRRLRRGRRRGRRATAATGPRRGVWELGSPRIDLLRRRRGRGSPRAHVGELGRLRAPARRPSARRRRAVGPRARPRRRWPTWALRAPRRRGRRTLAADRASGDARCPRRCSTSLTRR